MSFINAAKARLDISAPGGLTQASFPSLQDKSLADIVSKRDPNKKLHEFRKEWDATLQHLRDLQAIVAAPANRPDWVPVTAPPANRSVHPSRRAIIGFTFVARRAGR